MAKYAETAIFYATKKNELSFNHPATHYFLSIIYYQREITEQQTRNPHGPGTQELVMGSKTLLKTIPAMKKGELHFKAEIQ